MKFLIRIEPRDSGEGRKLQCYIVQTGKPDSFVLTGLVDREGLLLLNRIRDCLVEGNAYTFGIIVTACAKLGALHQGCIEMGLKKGSCNDHGYAPAEEVH
ncbi:hypothetical protein SASPL_110452 [Salvia splendens]|uniref:Uncharacterized protein n=1 Tax=Salvia splendens TaxID=180675 RepID=A0A8X8Y8W4_SALSN|nr:hypothetical protein SASPL_110452 [Salvia splendens]